MSGGGAVESARKRVYALFADSSSSLGESYSRGPVWSALDTFLRDKDAGLLESIANELLLMREAFEVEEMFPDLYSRWWASDCFILLERYRDALDFSPCAELGVRASFLTDRLLSLKLVVGERLSGADVLALCGPRTTSAAKGRLREVAEHIDLLLGRLWREAGTDYIRDWSKDSITIKYWILNGSPYVYPLAQVVKMPLYRFSANKRTVEFVRAITRDAENTLRRTEGLPNVGEGWVAETQLYHQVRSAFPQMVVQHHASPSWLGRQHLDIFIPEQGVALEYQGLQHDEPVEHFGGQEAFDRTRQRDLRKKRLCARHGVCLIYVRPGYLQQDVIEQVREAIHATNSAAGQEK